MMVAPSPGNVTSAATIAGSSGLTESGLLAWPAPAAAWPDVAAVAGAAGGGAAVGVGGGGGAQPRRGGSGAVGGGPPGVARARRRRRGAPVARAPPPHQVATGQQALVVILDKLLDAIHLKIVEPPVHPSRSSIRSRVGLAGSSVAWRRGGRKT